MQLQKHDELKRLYAEQAVSFFTLLNGSVHLAYSKGNSVISERGVFLLRSYQPVPSKQAAEQSVQKSKSPTPMRGGINGHVPLTGAQILQLQKTIGNSKTAQYLQAQLQPAQLKKEQASADPSLQVVQPMLENTSINSESGLGKYKSAVETYASELSAVVEEARSMIMTKYFVHVPAIDGYMGNFLDNFDQAENKFTNKKAVPRQAGYWIESYATKIAKPTPGDGVVAIFQAKRGNSRPDVVLQAEGQDIAWLDITSTQSEGHIFDKDSVGWLNTPYVTEVTYDPIKIEELNAVKNIPDKSAIDISGLLEKADEAYKEQLRWEAAVLENYGKSFAFWMNQAADYVKMHAVKSETEMELSEEDKDKYYSPDVPDNKFERLACSFAEDRAKRKVEPRELAAVIMYWKGMIERYNKQFEGNLPKELMPPPKSKLGLSWVKDVSSADGEPIIREWFPV